MAMKSVSDSKSTDGNHHKMDLVSFKKDLDKQQDEGEGWKTVNDDCDNEGWSVKGESEGWNWSNHLSLLKLHPTLQACYTVVFQQI